ncbi:hypothetical protein AB0M39_07930 [Streptomyces sp. NPDC051907]|uniref:hypothetical protein n=1 Tax=Streptomyces sp. NPDC051907 TaxID=3155284 RepID=UPI003429D9E9
MDTRYEEPTTDDRAASLHLQELALFLSVHLDRTPGILWPEHDHPAFGARPGPAGLAGLADGLGRLTGLAVRTRPGLRSDSVPGSGSGHRLIHHTAGAVNWQLRDGSASDAAEPLRWRIRPGEVLYVPSHWTWHAELALGTRFVVTHLVPSADPPGTP